MAKQMHLLDKHNVQAAERAAVILGAGERIDDTGYETHYAVQVVHVALGGFPTTIYKVPTTMTAHEAIGIERAFGQRFERFLPIPMMPTSEASAAEAYEENMIEVFGETEFRTFLDVFKLDVGSKVPDELVEKVMAHKFS